MPIPSTSGRGAARGHGTGISSTSSASAGTVKMMPTTARITCPARGRRAARTPSGTATMTASVSETTTR